MSTATAQPIQPHGFSPMCSLGEGVDQVTIRGDVNLNHFDKTNWLELNYPDGAKFSGAFTSAPAFEVNRAGVANQIRGEVQGTYYSATGRVGNPASLTITLDNGATPLGFVSFDLIIGESAPIHRDGALSEGRILFWPMPAATAAAAV